MNATAQRLCAWAGPLFIAIFAVGFWGIAGFIPPPSPSTSAQETADLFLNHTTSIRVGLMLTMIGAGLIVPWVAVVGVQLKEIEGRFAPLTLTQLLTGCLLPLEFIIPVFFWQVAAYRPGERSLETIQTLNDMAWLPFVGLTSTLIVQLAAVGTAILLDPSQRPVYPRWSGYFSFWALAMAVPASLVVFFHSGPFAWNGVLGFWMIVIAFMCWMLVFTRLTLKAVTRRQQESPDERQAPVSV